MSSEISLPLYKIFLITISIPHEKPRRNSCIFGNHIGPNVIFHIKCKNHAIMHNHLITYVNYGVRTRIK